MLKVIAISTFILSYIVEGFGVGIIFHLITTALLLLRERGIRVKISKFKVFEILGILLPTAFVLIIKRFSFQEFVILGAIRIVFYLYVRWDYANYRFYTTEYVAGDSSLDDKE